MTVKRKKIVLIVDDKREVRSLIRAIIESHFKIYELEILTASSSDIAIQIIDGKNGDIDIISTNIHRPGMDGYVFINYIKFKYPQIKVLICSGNAKLKDIGHMMERKLVDDFIKKPITERELIDKVRGIFSTQKVVRPSFA